MNLPASAYLYSMKGAYRLILLLFLLTLSFHSCKRANLNRFYYTSAGESQAYYQHQFTDSLGVHTITWDSTYNDYTDALSEFDQQQITFYTRSQNHICALPDSIFLFPIAENGIYTKIYSTHWILNFTLTEDSIKYICTNYGGWTGNFTSTSLIYKGKRQ
ncbi:MAG: hypothetical protein JNJ58_12710 [Chitinophagaceae bacterium]|nr:hypothetical protein [Chitinophagaceae bacterium]